MSKLQNEKAQVIIKENYGPIFGGTTNIYNQPQKTENKSGKENPSSKTPEEEFAYSKTEVVEYMSSLNQYTQRGNDTLLEILEEEAVYAWIFNTKRCSFRNFNKNHVFKFARMLRNHGFYEKSFTDTDLNLLLENSDKDTNYRKSMNKADAQEAKIEEIIKKRLRK